MPLAESAVFWIIGWRPFVDVRLVAVLVNHAIEYGRLFGASFLVAQIVLSHKASVPIVQRSEIHSSKACNRCLHIAKLIFQYSFPFTPKFNSGRYAPLAAGQFAILEARNRDDPYLVECLRVRLQSSSHLLLP